jgi:hypothetical protein
MSSNSNPAWSTLCARRLSESSSVRKTSWTIRAKKLGQRPLRTCLPKGWALIRLHPLPLLPPKCSSPHLSSTQVLTPAPRAYTSARIIGFCAIWVWIKSSF